MYLLWHSVGALSLEFCTSTAISSQVVSASIQHCNSNCCGAQANDTNLGINETLIIHCHRYYALDLKIEALERQKIERAAKKVFLSPPPPPTSSLLSSQLYTDFSFEIAAVVIDRNAHLNTAIYVITYKLLFADTSL